MARSCKVEDRPSYFRLLLPGTRDTHPRFWDSPGHSRTVGHPKLLIHLLIHSVIHSFIDSFIHSFIQLFILSLTHSFTFSLTVSIVPVHDILSVFLSVCYIVTSA